MISIVCIDVFIMGLFSCIYLLVDWLYLLISSFLWVLYLLNQSPICKDSQLLTKMLRCTHKCKHTASFPSLPTQIQHSTHCGSIQAVIWKTLFNSQKKKKSPCVKSTVSLAKKKHLGLPWRPVVTALCFQCSGRQFNPGLEAWLPRAAWHSQKENRPQGIKPMYKDALCDTIYNNRNKGDNKFKNSKLTKYLTQWETMKPEKERNEIDL